MKIAVCDDDRAELARIASMLDSYREERGVPLVHSEFLSSVELAYYGCVGTGSTYTYSTCSCRRSMG